MKLNLIFFIAAILNISCSKNAWYSVVNNQTQNKNQNLYLEPSNGLRISTGILPLSLQNNKYTCSNGVFKSRGENYCNVVVNYDGLKLMNSTNQIIAESVNPRNGNRVSIQEDDDFFNIIDGSFINPVEKESIENNSSGISDVYGMRGLNLNQFHDIVTVSSFVCSKINKQNKFSTYYLGSTGITIEGVAIYRKDLDLGSSSNEKKIFDFNNISSSNFLDPLIKVYAPEIELYDNKLYIFRYIKNNIGNVIGIMLNSFKNIDTNNADIQLSLDIYPLISNAIGIHKLPNDIGVIGFEIINENQLFITLNQSIDYNNIQHSLISIRNYNSNNPIIEFVNGRYSNSQIEKDKSNIFVINNDGNLVKIKTNDFTKTELIINNQNGDLIKWIKSTNYSPQREQPFIKTIYSLPLIEN